MTGRGRLPRHLRRVTLWSSASYGAQTIEAATCAADLVAPGSSARPAERVRPRVARSREGRSASAPDGAKARLGAWTAESWGHRVRLDWIPPHPSQRRPCVWVGAEEGGGRRAAARELVIAVGTQRWDDAEAWWCARVNSRAYAWRSDLLQGLIAQLAWVCELADRLERAGWPVEVCGARLELSAADPMGCLCGLWAAVEVAPGGRGVVLVAERWRASSADGCVLSSERGSAEELEGWAQALIAGGLEWIALH